MEKKILAIESSCDETAAAVVAATDNRQQMDNSTRFDSPIRYNRGLEILSNVVASQIDLHKKYGGVYPELASRAHAENILPVIDEALELAGCDKNLGDIEAIAVTYGPGLVGSLVAGLAAAKTLAYVFKKPILPINHWEGHLYSVWFGQKQPQFPALFLTVSGGHTNLILMKDHGKYEVLGSTVDDAAGEAFDKVARLLGLGYPGGPAISREAEKYNKDLARDFKLPRPMIDSGDFKFSFSGLKTAVLYKIKEIGELTEKDKTFLAWEFQEAATDTLIAKIKKAAEKYQPKSLCLTGGVAANKVLREKFAGLGEVFGDMKIFIPELNLTTDNAAMIGAAGYFNLLSGKREKWYDVGVNAGANLYEV